MSLFGTFQTRADVRFESLIRSARLQLAIQQCCPPYEADIQGIGGPTKTNSITTSADVVGATVVSTNTASANTKSLGTLRGRLECLATPTFLIYGTGGLAYRSAKPSTTAAQRAPMDLSETGGAGFEWMFTKDLSAKAEYLHYDLGTANFSGVATSTTIFITPIYQTYTNSARFSGDVVRTGLNYHFNAGRGEVLSGKRPSIAPFASALSNF